MNVGVKEPNKLKTWWYIWRLARFRFALYLLSGLLAGYDMAKRRKRSWFHGILYSVVIAITIFTVIDLDYPRFGVIRLTAADNAMIQLRDSIK